MSKELETAVAGELVPLMNKAEAEEAFKLLVEGAVEVRDMEAVMETKKEQLRETAEAIVKGKGWQALGYKDLEEACVDRLQKHLKELSRERKIEFMSVLSEAGISTRVIAATASMPSSTAHSQLSRNGTTEAGRRTGKDGKTYVSTKPKHQEDSKEQIGRLKEMVVTARQEGYSPESIHKALEPKITLKEIKEYIDESGYTFDTPLKNVMPPPAMNWKTGEGWEEAFPPPQYDAVSGLTSTLVVFMRNAREDRYLAKMGQLVAQSRDITKLQAAIDDIQSYFLDAQVVLRNQNAAKIVSAVGLPGTAAEEALKEWRTVDGVTE